MRKIAFIACAAVLLTAAAAQAQAPQGDPQKGRAMFSGQGGSGLCMLCHGGGAQGGFGPGLAGGRGLSFEQFKRAVQQPWGVMPRFPNINDEGLAHIYAFLKSLPAAPEPANWSVSAVSAPAPLGQQLMIQFGCGQCHGPEIGHPRRDIGEKMKEMNFEAFKKIIYQTAPAQMGLFNPDRLSDATAREIWNFMEAEGFRALLFASMSAPKPAGSNVTYELTLDNRGHKGSGLPADEVLVSLVVPKGFSVVSATGGSYQGVKAGVETVTNPGQLSPFRGMNPKPNPIKAAVDMAQWKVKSVQAADKVTLSITLTGTGTPNFSGSNVTWAKPSIKRLPTVTLKDDRLADKGDIIWGPSQEFTMPPAAKPAS
ncbi:MAG: c-type cytochrome [Vicinamibacterales bacterium]